MGFILKINAGNSAFCCFPLDEGVCVFVREQAQHLHECVMQSELLREAE